MPAAPTPSTPHLLVTPSGEIHTKSRRTARWFRQTLAENITAALRRGVPGAEVHEQDHRYVVTVPDADLALLDKAEEVCARVLGVHHVARATPVDASDLTTLTASVAELAREAVRGQTFAIRVKRRGVQPWTSLEAAREIGGALVDVSAGVDLRTPQVEVQVDVFNTRGVVLETGRPGMGGVPVRTQDTVLSLLSGGFDSPVASWMLMRRGAPCDYVHFKLDCAQSDHAMAVAYDLWRGWGAGTDPLVWVVDFQPIKERLFTDVPPRLRQIVLKQLMFAAADAIAAKHDHPALVTGESVGQVSSQTLRHLAEIDQMVTRTVLRPLAGLTKNEIIDWARRIGTAELSERAKEVCDLTDGPVAIAAQRHTLERARGQLPADLVAEAVATCEVIALSAWMPGAPLVPVVCEVPAGSTVIGDDEAQTPREGALAVRGPRAPYVASHLHARGREVVVLDVAADLGPLTTPIAVVDPLARTTGRAVALQ